MPELLRCYEGALSLADLRNIGYKDACNLVDHAIKIAEHTQKLQTKTASV